MADLEVTGVQTCALPICESFESVLRRFKKVVQEDRILSEIRQRRFFEKPSQIRKRKKAAKKRKSRRTTLKDIMRKY